MNFLPKLVCLWNKSLEMCLFHAPLEAHTAQGWPLRWPIAVRGTHRPQQFGFYKSLQGNPL